MSAINRVNYPFPEINKKDLEIPKSLSDRIYTYPDANGFTNLPGILNIINLPKDIYQASKSLRRAQEINDKEGSNDAMLRLLGAPVSFVHSSLNCLHLGVEVGALFNLFGNWALPKELVTSVAAPIAIAGLILCAYETIFEAINTKRQVNFLSHLSCGMREKLECISNEKDPVKQGKKVLALIDTLSKKYKKQLEAHPECKAHIDAIRAYVTTPNPQQKSGFLTAISALCKNIQRDFLSKDLSYLRKRYLTLSKDSIDKITTYVKNAFAHLPSAQQKEKFLEIYHERLELKLSQLARRVRPWCAKEIVEKLPSILEKIRSRDVNIQEEGVKEASELIQTVKVQAKKKLLVHVIALIALGISIAGFIATIVGCPFSIPVFLLLIAGGIGIANYFISKGTLDCKGWSFSFYNTLPSWIQKLIQKITLHGAQGSSVPPSNSPAAAPLTGRAALAS